MWLMILIAVHLNDPKDIPGRITLQFQTQQQCEQILSTMTYWLKFESFKVEGKCQKIS
jgi:hypothetical protein